MLPSHWVFKSASNTHRFEPKTFIVPFTPLNSVDKNWTMAYTVNSLFKAGRGDQSLTISTITWSKRRVSKTKCVIHNTTFVVKRISEIFPVPRRHGMCRAYSLRGPSRKCSTSQPPGHTSPPLERVRLTSPGALHLGFLWMKFNHPASFNSQVLLT